jgi:hypothetical protein
MDIAYNTAMLEPRMTRRLRSTLWGTAAFLVGTAALIVILSHFYLLPAMEAAKNADTSGKRQLSASAALLLCVVLFVLAVGVLLVFRVRRMFTSSGTETREKTDYIDAWKEAGRRARELPPADEEMSE